MAAKPVRANIVQLTPPLASTAALPEAVAEGLLVVEEVVEPELCAFAGPKVPP